MWWQRARENRGEVKALDLDEFCVRCKFYGQATKGMRVDALAQSGDEGRS